MALSSPPRRKRFDRDFSPGDALAPAEARRARRTKGHGTDRHGAEGARRDGGGSNKEETESLAHLRCDLGPLRIFVSSMNRRELQARPQILLKACRCSWKSPRSPCRWKSTRRKSRT